MEKKENVTCLIVAVIHVGSEPRESAVERDIFIPGLHCIPRLQPPTCSKPTAHLCLTSQRNNADAS